MIAEAHRRALGLLLSLALVVSAVGVAWPVWRHGGGAISERVSSQRLIERQDDQAAADLMARELYGEPIETREPHAAAEWTSNAEIERIRATERLVSAMLLAGVLAIPLISVRKPWIAAVLAALTAVWLLVDARCAALNGGKAFSELAVPAHAARWCLPLVLALLVCARPGADRAAKLIAMGACSLTFATHGWEAWQLNPPFVDQLALSFRNIGVIAEDPWIHGCLKTIGVMDGLLAAAILIRPRLVVPAWMALWGLATAVGRIWAFGPAHWHETAMRAANFALPAFVLGLLVLARREARRQCDHQPPSPS